MNAPMNQILTGLLLALLLIPGQAPAAGLFKWTDKNGVVHFSDQPHNDPKAERVAMPRASTPAAPPPAPEHNGSESNPADAVRERQEALARHQQEVRAANCEIARRTLEHNQNIRRMFRLDENGDRVFLSEEEREEVLKRSQDDIAQWCDA